MNILQTQGDMDALRTFPYYYYWTEIAEMCLNLMLSPLFFSFVFLIHVFNFSPS